MTTLLLIYLIRDNREFLYDLSLIYSDRQSTIMYGYKKLFLFTFEKSEIIEIFCYFKVGVTSIVP